MLAFISTNTLILIFQLLYVVTALGVIVVIISENRNPLKTMSWILILVFLPLAGLIVYYFFGEDGRKKRLISHRMFKKLSRKSVDKRESEEIVPPKAYKSLINLLQNLERSSLYAGNKITFYSDGKSKFEALLEEIRKAEKHIHIQYYIFTDEKIGRKIRDLLIEKVKQGVVVRLIYDDVGCWSVRRKYFRDMQANGIEVQPFLEVAFKYLTSRVNYRNHRKIVVIDGKVGFMGGMNVADRYIEGVKTGVWRDNHIKIEGKAVAALQASFIIDWNFSRKEFLSSKTYFPEIEDKGDNLMQLATSGPIGQYRNIHLGIVQAIYNAKESIYIQTPYFVPTDALLMAIQTASLRGVDVRLMIPLHSDTIFVHYATMAFLSEMLEARVKVYLFEKGFIHSKLLVIDGSLTITGSANMDARSFEHNFEINTFIYNEETSRKAQDIFYKDVELSSFLLIEEWSKRSFFQKTKESIVRLLSPLL